MKLAGPAAVGLLGGGLDACSPSHGGAFAQTQPLQTLAARTGRIFGTEVLHKELALDPAYAALVKSQCGQITPGLELKWGVFQPTPDEVQTGPVEWLLRWAEASGLSVRGHTLLWYRNQPKWALSALLENAHAVVARRITEPMLLYKGRIVEWDVVNEAIEPNDGRSDGLRNSIFLDTLGPNYIGDAFKLARQADPGAKLFYNEYGMEYDTRDAERRRTCLLRLLEKLKHDGAPVDGLGIQGHLYADTPLHVRAFRNFLNEAAGMGLTIKVTEFDVRDHFAVLTRFGALDGRISDAVQRYLDILLDVPAVSGLVTWGLANRYSDLRVSNRWDSPLPYDDALEPKAMRAAVADAFLDARIVHRDPGPRTPGPSANIPA